MSDRLSSLLRANPDVLALALIVALTVPSLGAAQPRLSLIFAANRPAQSLELRGERVWQRLEQQMRRFEQRFDRLAPPRARAACTETAAD
jgi:hypothetical protein